MNSQYLCGQLSSHISARSVLQVWDSCKRRGEKKACTKIVLVAFFTALCHFSKPFLFYSIPPVQLHLLSYYFPEWFSSLFSLPRNERPLPFCSEISLCCLLFCCFVSFSLIFPPGQEIAQMFIHQPQCVEAFSVSQIIALMFLCGSMSNLTRGISLLTGEAMLKTYLDHIMQMSLNIALVFKNWRKRFSWFHYQLGLSLFKNGEFKQFRMQKIIWM